MTQRPVSAIKHFGSTRVDTKTDMGTLQRYHFKTDQDYLSYCTYHSISWTTNNWYGNQGSRGRK